MKDKLRDMCQICLPPLMAMGFVFLGCLPQIIDGGREQRNKNQAEYQKNVLDPYNELVNWAQTNNIVSGDYSRAYDSDLIKFLAQRF